MRGGGPARGEKKACRRGWGLTMLSRTAPNKTSMAPPARDHFCLIRVASLFSSFSRASLCALILAMASLSLACAAFKAAFLSRSFCLSLAFSSFSGGRFILRIGLFTAALATAPFSGLYASFFPIRQCSLFWFASRYSEVLFLFFFQYLEDLLLENPAGGPQAHFSLFAPTILGRALQGGASTSLGDGFCKRACDNSSCTQRTARRKRTESFLKTFSTYQTLSVFLRGRPLQNRY